MEKKPLAIIFTDSHLEKSTIEQNISIFNQINEAADELEIKEIYHLGDIFESRRAQPEEILNQFTELIDIFKGKNFYVIPGNHDKNSYESENSYLDVYQHHPGFNLIRDYSFLNRGELMLHFIPYFKEETLYSKYLTKTIQTIKKYPNEKHILLTHISITGVSNNDRMKVENNLKQNMFSSFQKVFVGHYHNKEEIGKNITYIGSCYPSNYGEDNEKGFMILFDDGSYEFRSLNFKKYYKRVINLNETSSDSINKILNEYISIKEDQRDNLRLEFIGDETKLKALDQNRFKSVGIDVKLKLTSVVEGIDQAKENKFVTFDVQEILGEFEEYCEKNKPSNIKYGKSKLNQILKR